MSESIREKLSQPILSAIQDAVLFGNIKELSGVLDLAEFEPDFPSDLRHSLEALLYFRMNYGKGGELEPAGSLTRSLAALMENDWGKKILDMTNDEGNDLQQRQAS
jgi:hypothetical protein